MFYRPRYARSIWGEGRSLPFVTTTEFGVKDPGPIVGMLKARLFQSCDREGEISDIWKVSLWALTSFKDGLDILKDKEVNMITISLGSHTIQELKHVSKYEM